MSVVKVSTPPTTTEDMRLNLESTMTIVGPLKRSSISMLITVIILKLSKHHGCVGLMTSPLVGFGCGSKASTSALNIFGRKSRRAKQQREINDPLDSVKTELKIVSAEPVVDLTSMITTRTELKIVPGSSKVAPRALDNLFFDSDQWRVMPEGVASPKVLCSSSIITEEEVLAAHQAWGNGLVQISKAFEENGYDEAKKVAKSILDVAYGYAKGIPVLFKPTLASGSKTFRTTEEGALSYFVGGNKSYHDSGFAIQGWRKVESYPAGILLLGNFAFSTGSVRCTDKNGKCTIVDKTWGYQKDSEGNVRIILHHSSLPYQS